MEFPCKTCCEHEASCCHNAQIIWNIEEFDALVTDQPQIAKQVVIFKGELPGMIYVINRSAIEDSSSDVALDYCTFYDTTKNCCSIYEHRPFVCKTYGDPTYNSCPYEGMSDISLIDLIKNNKELAQSMHKTAYSNPVRIAEEYIFPFVDRFKKSNHKYQDWWQSLPNSNFVRA